MFYIYDFYDCYIAKTDSYRWAKIIADRVDGYVMGYCPFDGEYIIYDSYEEFIYSIF